MNTATKIIHMWKKQDYSSSPKKEVSVKAEQLETYWSWRAKKNLRFYLQDLSMNFTTSDIKDSRQLCCSKKRKKL